MKILVINGPNLNMLGKRDPVKYGTLSLETIKTQLSACMSRQAIAKKCDCTLIFFQSNCEGAIIDFLQKESSREADGILINPGVLVRYGYSLRQALIDHGKPFVEVHMSDINKTGVNKSVNVLEDIRLCQVVSLKKKSYFVGLKKLILSLRGSRSQLRETKQSSYSRDCFTPFAMTKKCYEHKSK
ncbi:type II 3-dehydroquinate dehydratase [Candidatus Microgenomates bacterium]|nr:type II 3-dehydroquinate dehydratase [Candidatus Microgenomates bacterium]